MNLYHYLKRLQFKKHQSRKKEISFTWSNPLNQIMQYASKHIPYYKPYKNLPISLWPIIDKSILSEQPENFVSKGRNKQENSFEFNVSSQEIQVFWQQLKLQSTQIQSVKNKSNHSRAFLKYLENQTNSIWWQPKFFSRVSPAFKLGFKEELSGMPQFYNLLTQDASSNPVQKKWFISEQGIFAMVCQHNLLKFNPVLYYLEPAWIDEQQQRMVPIVTTLTRTQQPLIRFRMDELLLQVQTNCGCIPQDQYGYRVVGRAEDIIYVSHLFEKQLLPLYPDQVEFFFRKFPSILHYQIVQQSIHQWLIKVDSPDILALQDSMQLELSEYLLSFNMKCPNIEVESFKPIDKQSKQKIVKSFYN